MNTLFILQPVFRLLAPLVIGMLGYLLILMFNNNFFQLSEIFRGEELYLCIGLAFIIQEATIWSPKISGFDDASKDLLRIVLLQSIAMLLFAQIVITIAVYSYFYFRIGYLPERSETLMFCSVFGVLSMLYVVIYYSYSILMHLQKQTMDYQLHHRDEAKNQLDRYVHGMNYDLLMQCLENITATMRTDTQRAEDITKELSSYYRYILQNRNKEVILAKDEIKAAKNFASLLTKTGQKTVSMQITASDDYLFCGSLLKIIQLISTTSIDHENTHLNISLHHKEGNIILMYQHHDKLGLKITHSSLDSINQQYAIYSNYSVSIEEAKNIRKIIIPTIQLSQTHPNLKSN